MDAHKLKVVRLEEDERSLVVSMQSEASYYHGRQEYSQAEMRFDKRLSGGETNPAYPLGDAMPAIGDGFVLQRSRVVPNVVVHLKPRAEGAQAPGPFGFEQVVEQLRHVALECQRGDERNAALYRQVVAILYFAEAGDASS